MSKIKLELVTPEELMFSEQIDSVVVPGSEGDFGVLYNHSPMISTIRPGLVSIKNEGENRDIFVSGGFAEITGDRCTILAEEAVDAADLSAQDLANLISDAENKAK